MYIWRYIDSKNARDLHICHSCQFAINQPRKTAAAKKIEVNKITMIWRWIYSFVSGAMTSQTRTGIDQWQRQVITRTESHLWILSQWVNNTVHNLLHSCIYIFVHKKQCSLLFLQYSQIIYWQDENSSKCSKIKCGHQSSIYSNASPQSMHDFIYNPY